MSYYDTLFQNIRFYLHINCFTDKICWYDGWLRLLANTIKIENLKLIHISIRTFEFRIFNEGTMNCSQKIFLILLLFTSSIFSQWTNQNLVPEGNHLWSTFFINDNTGWIAGSEGLIKKTSNGGIDWALQNSGTKLTLKSIQFINPTSGWLIGENGLILKSTDGGQTWVQQNSNTSESLNDLHFYNLNTGYIVGTNGIILKTTDGGSNWSNQVSGISNTLYSVDFIDDLLGYAVGENRLFLKTTDGGTNWEIKNLSLSGVPIINCVEFINSQVGWIGFGFDKYSSNIMKTTDGGESWSSTAFAPVSAENSENHLQMENPLDVQVGIRSIYFKDSNNGYAVGGTYDGWNRCIYTTTNGGNTWQSKYSYSEQTGLLSVRVNEAGEGFAVGYSGVIYRTNDGGSSWSQLLSGNNNLYYSGDCLTSVFMVNENIGWAGGYRKGIWYYPILMKTTDGGKIWETNKEFSNDFISAEANIYFLNESIGWVNFYDRSSYKTTDGGESWVSCGNAGNQKYFINQDTGWGTYEPLGIFKSTDGGSTWVQKSSVSSRSIFFPDVNNGWAVGIGGSILKSTDQGENWFAQTSGTSSNLNSIDLYNDNIGMCVGNTGTILMTTNGGDSWISQNASQQQLNLIQLYLQMLILCGLQELMALYLTPLIWDTIGKPITV